MEIFKVEINEDSTGIQTMSFVKFPAVDINWVTLSKQPCLLFDEEKHIVTSVALRANYPILRDNNYCIVFTPETIYKIVKQFFKEKRGTSVNLEHSVPVEHCYLIESYFAKPNNEFGVEEGSWICSYQVDNPQVWADIKNKKLNGFSIEGYFNYTPYDEMEEEVLKIIK